MPLRGGWDSPSTINSFPVRHCPSVLPRPCPVYSSSMLRLAPSMLSLIKAIQKNVPYFSEGFGINHYSLFGGFPDGAGFPLQSFLRQKWLAIPLQSLTRSAFEAYAKRQNGSH